MSAKTKLGVAAAAATFAATLAATLAFKASAQTDARRSGFDFMSPSTQALQRDDTQNPAMLWVQMGHERFTADCLRCHTVDAMRGVAARYPAWSTPAAGIAPRPLTLQAKIQACQQHHVKGSPLAPESEALLALEAYVARQSRGMPIEPPARDPRLAPALQVGEQLYRQRLGQLDLSCAQCHDQQAGKRLGGSAIPQGHPTGYPLYRLEWQHMGSLQRRLRACLTGVRAEPYAYGSTELTALELFLKQRAAGMSIDAPAVRP